MVESPPEAGATLNLISTRAISVCCLALVKMAATPLSASDMGDTLPGVLEEGVLLEQEGVVLLEWDELPLLLDPGG
jgi:hypothetical protein